MTYCPHCSAQLPKPMKICPFCKRTVDLDLISSVYKPGESSDIQRKIKRKIWFREKLIIILPIITLVIGFAAGAIVMFVYAEIQFASTRNDYEDRIATLQETIAERDQNAASSQLELNQILAEKDLIIASLTEQNQIFSRMIAFTSRLSRNSTITPNSPQDIDFFQRNIRYLQNLFNQEQEKLGETSYESSDSYNLVPIPQLLE
ncbi:MAG: hypothetical protein KAV45_09695 [Calditrichia bacterium]|nr:hypothetical protein [Calditrichia bacterium]